MENNALYDYEPLESVTFYIKQFFDQDIELFEIADIAQIVLPKIGNEQKMVYHYFGKGSTASNIGGNLESVVEVPCNLQSIESVSVVKAGLNKNMLIEKQVVVDQIRDKEVYRGASKSNLYPQGEFIRFQFLGDKIVIDEKYNDSTIHIIYRGDLVDKDGLPLVNRREAEVVAHYWNFIRLQRRMFQGLPDNGMMQLAEQRYKEALIKARSLDSFTQNQLDRIVKSNKAMNYSSQRFSNKISF